MSGLESLIAEALQHGLDAYWGNGTPKIEGHLESLCTKLKSAQGLIEQAKVQTDPLWAAHLLETA